MRRLILTACALGLLSAGNPQLEAIHTVYMLPMSNSLDQYLATGLTASGVFQVVTDPQKADGIFTDKIGQAFEQKMDELYPPEGKKEEEEDQNDPYGKNPVRVGAFSKARGTVYLVDRRTRNVVWSLYSPARSSRPDDVNRDAESIIKKLLKDLKPK